MSTLTLRQADECRYDLVSLGEVMLRLDPGDVRVGTARTFKVWEGGGEYNVARGLRRCFGLKTAVATALRRQPRRPPRRRSYSTRAASTRPYVHWKIRRRRPHARNGLNFTERGFGVRGALGMLRSRQHRRLQLKPGDIDWDDIFGKQGVRWLHTGGIFAALSDTTAARSQGGHGAARRHGTISPTISTTADPLEVHRRQERATEVNRELARYVDVMIGNEEDFTACLGFQVEGAGRRPRRSSTPAASGR